MIIANVDSQVKICIFLKIFDKNKIDGEYYKSGKYYLCILCFSKFKAEVCATCGKSIIDQAWTAMGKNYHYECLVCLKCGGTFDENGFITIDDNPFHEECIAVYCGFCEESIIDEYFEIDGEVQNI